VKYLNAFSEITADFDAYLFDLWGVIHDGEHLYPNVMAMVENLAAQGKAILFLSNAPRLAQSVINKLTQLGIRREWYVDALTSGEAAHRYLHTLPARNYVYQGLESDAALLQGIPQQRVQPLEDADFILNGNFDYHGQPLAEVMPRLQQALSINLPMLCINPDLEVVKQDGSHIQCAGFIAAQYEQLGGKVEYIGKPHPLVYRYALERLGEPALTRTLMVGDNPLTDIRGGNQAGIPTLLLTQGVLQEAFKAGETLESYCRKCHAKPDYILDRF
jgi:HAD superfamily hydrolase (TIGR01459 family)